MNISHGLAHNIELMVLQAINKAMSFSGLIANIVGIRKCCKSRAEKAIDQNCREIREFCINIAKERREGKMTSEVKGVDLVSLLLESEFAFTDDDVADEIIDFLSAGAGTTQVVT